MYIPISTRLPTCTYLPIVYLAQAETHRLLRDIQQHATGACLAFSSARSTRFSPAHRTRRASPLPSFPAATSMSKPSALALPFLPNRLLQQVPQLQPNHWQSPPPPTSPPLLQSSPPMLNLLLLPRLRTASSRSRKTALAPASFDGPLSRRPPAVAAEGSKPPLARAQPQTWV